MSRSAVTSRVSPTLRVEARVVAPATSRVAATLRVVARVAAPATLRVAPRAVAFDVTTVVSAALDRNNGAAGCCALAEKHYHLVGLTAWRAVKHLERCTALVGHVFFAVGAARIARRCLQQASRELQLRQRDICAIKLHA